MGFLAVLLLSAASGVLYRMGGSGNYSKQARRVGCVLCSFLALWAVSGLIPGLWLAYVLFFGLSYLAITTYHDWTGADNFFLHGLFLGLASFALLPLGVHWYAIVIRSVALSVLMGVWCLIWKWDIAAEVGRGFFIVATIPLLLI